MLPVDPVIIQELSAVVQETIQELQITVVLEITRVLSVVVQEIIQVP